MAPAVVPFQVSHLAAVLALCEAEGWPSLPADPARAHRVLTAPNAITLVALDEEVVVGFAAAVSDGAIDVYLSTLVVAADSRRKHVATDLLAALFQATGVQRIDLLAEPGSEAFYDSMPHRRFAGYRLYAQTDE